MCSFLLTTRNIDNLKKTNYYLQRRGPDHTELRRIDKFSILYNLLKITQSFTKQPFVKDNLVTFYNGEIYNFKEYGDFANDGECLLGLYEKHGKDFFRLLDGEFAICIIDLEKEIILFCTDIFKTKPLWYSIQNDDIGISSYKSSLESLGHENIICAKPNSIYMYDLKSRKLSADILYEFDLRQYKDSYDDWIIAFEEAVKKRTGNTYGKIFIGLSSGYDSGAIFCELLKQKIDFRAYSVLGEENLNLLQQRHNMHDNSLFLDAGRERLNIIWKHLAKYCEKYEHPYFDMIGDESTWGLGLLCMQAGSDGRKIFLSGTGADEIISDYGHNGMKYNNNSEFGGHFPKNLSDIFPWRNFFFGSQECYLAREEYVAGSYGLEARYPFLDKNVVQEFLWLDSELKNKKYKAPINEYFQRNNFPFIEEKVGFFFNKHDFDINSIDPLLKYKQQS